MKQINVILKEENNYNCLQLVDWGLDLCHQSDIPSGFQFVRIDGGPDGFNCCLLSAGRHLGWPEEIRDLLQGKIFNKLFK